MYPTYLEKINSYTDSKVHKNPFKYLLNESRNKIVFTDSNLFFDLRVFGGIQSPLISLLNATKQLNSNIEYTFMDLKSTDQQILSGERNPRGLVNPTKPNLNLKLNTSHTSEVLNNTLKSDSNKQGELFNLSNLNWGTTCILSKMFDTKTSFPNNHAPSISTNLGLTPQGFSRFSSNGITPKLLRSKEEAAPNFIFNTYWLTTLANTDFSRRLGAIKGINQLLDENYFPTLTEYAEYDFRNWQALELLEDAFWESTYSSFSQDEYINTRQNIYDHAFFKKQEELFNLFNRSHKFKNNTLMKSPMRDLTIKDTINRRPILVDEFSPKLGELIDEELRSELKPSVSPTTAKPQDLGEVQNTKKNTFEVKSRMDTLPISADEFVPNTNLRPLKDFKLFSNEGSVDSLEDSYENLKAINYLHYMNYINVINFNTPGMQPISYATILNAFRADYDESPWSLDNFLAAQVSNPNYVNFNDSTDLRISNPLKLRSTAKSSIITYNAIQKVFKSRFDEGRSNTRLGDISNSYPKHMFLSEQKTPYESLLGKNKDSFFNINNYNQELIKNFNDIFSNWTTLNTYFTDLPFLVSTQSDSSRFLWFDWHSRWTSIEVQPSSVSRYSLLGVPYPTKNFEYTTQVGENVNESETYLIRLSRARKNYMSNWAYTPYFYSRVSNWYKVNTLFNPLMSNFSVNSLRLSLEVASNYWEDNTSNNDNKLTSTPSFSGINTPNRSSWQPESSLGSEYYNTAVLVDLLTKREFLYREYFLNKGYSINLPNYLTSNPNNPLIEEIKKSYPFTDPSSFSSELSREFLYQNNNFIKFLLTKDTLISAGEKLSNLGPNLSSITNYLFFYFLDNTQNSDLGKNKDLLKNQYRPLKKGVTNMIRLHATGAIAMPTEIRLHILASSRDVIHSWALPSAGIKIDCVPGFSTHRVSIFLLSGVFWGQCMEICGRFHHWMPIIVYFMKRDLFFLWCIHFIHFSTDKNEFDTNDKQLSDNLALVSFNSEKWSENIHRFI
jgi:hypothetical protein